MSQLASPIRLSPGLTAESFPLFDLPQGVRSAICSDVSNRGYSGFRTILGQIADKDPFLDYDYGTLRAVYCGGVMLGWMCIAHAHRRNEPPWFDIMGYVRPDFRRQGIALAAATSLFEEMNIPSSARIGVYARSVENMLLKIGGYRIDSLA